jgi:hypothetical protein
MDKQSEEHTPKVGAAPDEPITAGIIMPDKPAPVVKAPDLGRPERFDSVAVGMAPGQDGPGSAGVVPGAVVATYSTRGLEYFIMLISLGIAASSVASLLHSSLDQLYGSTNQLYGTTLVSLSSAALVVTLPIFAFLFLRLKKAELENPMFKSDPSRKRAIQIMLVLTFLVGICNVISYLFAIFNGGKEDTAYSLVATGQGTGVVGNALHMLITLVIAGSIFAYYWYDEHRRG